MVEEAWASASTIRYSKKDQVRNDLCYSASMQNQTTSENPFIGLARWGRPGDWRWHVAALGAGWLLFLRKPPLQSRAAASMTQVLLGGALLIAILFVIGPVLSWLQPAFRALGQLSGLQLLLLFAGALNVWRYAKGRSILIAIQSHHVALSTACSTEAE